MGQEVEFPQRWELRRGSYDSDSSSGSYDSDSSGGSSRSSSRGDPVFKKLKLVTSLVPVENAELAEANKHQQSNTETQPKTGKVKRAQTDKSKKRNAVPDNGKTANLVQDKSKKSNPGQSKSKTPNSVKRKTRKRKLVQHKAKDSPKQMKKESKITTFFEPAILDELKLFGETLLEDLNVAKENLLLQMKEAINKLVSDNYARQLTRRQDSNCQKDIPIPVQNPNYRKNIQDQCQNNIDKNVPVQCQDRFKSGKDRHSNQSDRSIKVQPAKFKSSSKSQNRNGELSVSVRGEGVAVENLSPVIGTPPVKERRRRRSKLPGRPDIQSDSFGPDNEVQLAKTFNLGGKLPKYNRNVLERSAEGKRRVEVTNVPQYLTKNMDIGQDIGQLAPNEKNVGRCSLSIASDILTNPSDHNCLLQHQMNTESCMKLINYSGGSLEKFVQGKITSDPGNCYRGLEDQLIHGQIAGGIPPNVRDAVERFGLNYLSNTTGQVGSSMYLPLSSFLTAPLLGNQRLDAACNYMQPSAAGNALVVNSGSTDPMPNTSVLNRVFPVMGPEGDIGSFFRTNAINMNYPSHKRAMTSGNGTGLPLPFLESTENGCTSKDPSQASLDNSPQGTDNIESPTRINRGRTIMTSGGISVSSGQNMANNFHKPFIQETSGGLISVSTPDSKEGI